MTTEEKTPACLYWVACCCFFLCLKPPNVVGPKASSVLRCLCLAAARNKLYVYSLFWAVCCSLRFSNLLPVHAIKYDTLILQTPCCDSEHIVLRLSTCTKEKEGRTPKPSSPQLSSRAPAPFSSLQWGAARPPSL